ncbi:3-isopropylmalate dehydratase [bacterium]|nr:3-isopropylmalate dehydratase [bacterium]
MEKIKGTVWKFGDNIDTDILAPWQSMGMPWEERRTRIIHNRPEFVDQVKEGDVIIAGKNWGCGSSREQAAENVKLLGVAAVVAESFGRIFFRNAVALALPAVACPGISDAFDEGDELELDLKASKVKNVTKNTELDAISYTEDMIDMIDKGGILAVLKEKLGTR